MGSDSFLYYNVGQWGRYGLAIPNPGKGPAAGLSQNDNILYLNSVVARNLQALMFHPDAGVNTPPSINTLTRIHKLCVRARDILASRAIPSGVPNMEGAHANPAPNEFLFFPTPYFTVRNQWLKDYAGLILLALTEAMQNQERNKPIEISVAFAGLFGQYIQRVYYRMSTELFRVPSADALKPDFTLSDQQLASYNPAAWFTSTELNDTIDGFDTLTTEDDREVLTRGIAYGLLPLASLGPYPGAASVVPVGATPSATGPASTSAFAPPPSV